jgi:alkylation response protein AidB-like acyl-CoA dehydrogenase
VDLIPSVEQDEIAAAAAAVLERRAPLSELRSLDGRDSSVDPESWRVFGELGLFGIGLAEEFGGVGYGMAEEAMVFREIGRILAPGPFIGSTLGARVGAEHEPGLARSILSGETVVALAEPRGPVDLAKRHITGDMDVIDGVGATHAVAVAPQGAVLFSLGDLEIITEPCIDLGVRLGRAHLDAVPVLAEIPSGPGDLAQRGAVLAAAMLVGISEASRDMAVRFAKDRIQFGKPIGTYQAIKHRAADMAVRAELAVSQLLFAAVSVDENHPDAAFQTSTAKLVATRAALENTAANVQIHGGMGYTYECDAHLYVTRTHILEFVLGTTRDHLASLIDATPGETTCLSKQQTSC